jgi:ubiquinone/menaquinone biosynthesis C-methylase UbiE
LWRLTFPYTDVERRARARDLRDAYALHVKVLSRPGMRKLLEQAEREDLATLPFFAASLPMDMARVLAKRMRGAHTTKIIPPDDFPYPDYYLHDFHNQANGNLSLHSALTYEWQIRFLFCGTNRLMRQGVVDQIPEGSGLKILDVACGTGTWVTMARAQNRLHHVTGIDLSPHYLRVAQFFRGQNATFLQMNAEHLRREWTEQFDVVTCVWLFHELPRHAIERVMMEMARVLRPGGRLIFMDAVQPDDVQAPDGLEVCQHFHDLFAEPYFMEYQSLNLHELFAHHCFVEEKREVWYRSKIVTLRKLPTAVAAA